jgi:hypothetical protein
MGGAWVVFVWTGNMDWKMERFVMNSKTTVLAAATAALLTAATVNGASAQTQERNDTRMNAGQNLSTGRQMNAQGPNAQGPGVNARTQFQGGVNRSEGAKVGRSEFQGTNRSAMTSNRHSGTNGLDRNRERFAYGDRDRDRYAFGRDRDRNRVEYSGRYRDRVAYSSGSYGDRYAYSGRDRVGYGGWGGSGWGGPTFDVSVGYGGWGWPGYYDYGYGSGYPGLYSYAPGYTGVGFGGDCSCGGPGWGW